MKKRRNQLNIQAGQTETFHYEAADTFTRGTGIKRVAAYCRVSTLAEEQDLSFETQVEYYKTMIEKDPTMQLVGIYGDHGFSGLHADRRKEFQRLIADCEAGKVDVVLVKSISRFSRNTVECMEYLQRLKKCGVAVVFEKEDLNSMDQQTELILSIYSSMAQSESCSHSENIRWARKQRAELGDPVRGAAYGYRIVKKPGDPFSYWEIDEEAAEYIRFIFAHAYEGYTTTEILTGLNRKLRNEGKETWSIERLRLALNNEAYRGDILTNKFVVLDYLAKKIVRNRGQVEQCYIEGHHPPIVLPEIFDAVQDYMKQGCLNGRNKLIRSAWLSEHPEILERRNHKEETV